MEDLLESKLTLSSNDSSRKSYLWSFKVNGMINLGHIVPLLRIAELLDRSHSVTILFDDSVATNKIKEKIEEIKKLIESFCSKMNCKDKCTFITTSQLRDNEEYVMEFFKLISVTTESQAEKCISSVDNLKMYNLVEPILFINDAKFVESTTVILGENKEAICGLSDTILPEIHKGKLDFSLHPVIHDFKNNVMSKRNQLTRLDVVDTKKNVEKKVRKYFCDEENVETALFDIVEHVIFPFLCRFDKKFVIIDLEKCETEYENILNLKESFKLRKIHPGDLKEACSGYINEIFDCFSERTPEYLKIIKSIFN